MNVDMVANMDVDKMADKEVDLVAHMEPSQSVMTLWWPLSTMISSPSPRREDFFSSRSFCEPKLFQAKVYPLAHLLSFANIFFSLLNLKGTFIWVDGSGWSDYGNWIRNQPTSSVTDTSEKQVERIVINSLYTS